MSDPLPSSQLRKHSRTGSSSLETQSDYKKKTLALIVTVYKEVATIWQLLESYRQQSLLADEMIIVDADSQDGTAEIVAAYAAKYQKLNIRFFVKAGNRSQGRNFALRKSQADWIAITDAGCRLDPDWLKHLMMEQKRSGAEVVAGYYRGEVQGLWQEAFVPYFLVMPWRLQQGRFLPATRSMLIKKSRWLAMGGLNEKLLVSEDFEFARRLQAARIPIAFAQQAIVFWQAPETPKEFFQKISAFAAGDIRAGILRPKVLLLFLRATLALIWFFLILWNALLASTLLWPLFWGLLTLVFLYALWSIFKNLRACSHAWFLLPFVQLLADLAVLWGTLMARFA